MFSETDDEIIISELPHGNCVWCCPINLETDVKFLLYTRRNRNEGILLSHKNPAPDIRRSTRNPARPTIVYLHGFLERVPSASSTNIKNGIFVNNETYFVLISNNILAYLDSGDYNVILVDWSPLSAGPWYINAVRNSYFVGAVLARFLLLIDQPDLFPLDNIHVIGFSLGAEAAGFAGKAMPRSTKKYSVAGSFETKVIRNFQIDEFQG